MKIIVLGSGAAGATRPAAGPGVPPRTQDAIAVSDGENAVKFVKAAQEAYWLEVHAHLFEANVQDALDKCYADRWHLGKGGR